MTRPFLMAWEKTLPSEVFDRLRMRLKETPNVVDPVLLRHEEGLTSYRISLHFDVVRKQPDSKHYLVVTASGLELNRADLLLESTLTRTPYHSNDSSDDADRSTWPAPAPATVQRHTASGEIGCVRVNKTRSLIVRVNLFGPKPARLSSPLVVSLNEFRKAGSMCDVVFVADGHEFHAHKVVVAARSVVFRSMFSGTFVEGRDGRAVIEGVSKDVFEKFIEFLYVDHIENWDDQELELLQLADRYMVDHLKEACRLRLWQVDGSRALQLVRLSAESDRTGPGPLLGVPTPVRRRAVRIVVDNWPVIANTPQWRDFENAFPLMADVVLACTTTQHVDEFHSRSPPPSM